MPQNNGAETTELLLLVTEQQVFAYDLSRVSRITIGRHESNDLQLVSRTVSNFHAEIVRENGSLLLRDLGSTNGTHVNDVRVEKMALGTGDRIRVGNHTVTMELKPAADPKDGFIRYQKQPEAFGPGTRGRIISLRGRSADIIKTLQADDPNDLSLPDLLKLLSANSGTAFAVITRSKETARIFVHKQRIVHAEYGTAVGEKALYRLFGWQSASYEVKELASVAPIPRTIHLPTDTLIVEGMKHSLELGKLVAQLPPMEVPLRLKEDCPLPLTAHSPAEVEIFQSIIRQETIGNVLETSPLTDLRVLRLIESLLRKGVFQVEKSGDALMEETWVSPRR